jgi:membrane-associated phospholipid phosphatase
MALHYGLVVVSSMSSDVSSGYTGFGSPVGTSGDGSVGDDSSRAASRVHSKPPVRANVASVDPTSPPTVGVVDPVRAGAYPGSVTVALTVGLAAVFFDIWLGGPLKAADLRVARWAISESSPLFGPAHVLDRIGLRGLTVTILLLFAYALGRRLGTWRPLGLIVVAVFLVNLIVGVLKIVVGRGRPALWAPDPFVGDVMWPSGHAANIVLTTALLFYLFRVYGQRPISLRREVLAVSVPSVVMTVVSAGLRYHWLSDLVAGSIVGLLVVVVVTRWDQGRRSPASGSTSRTTRSPWPRVADRSIGHFDFDPDLLTVFQRPAPSISTSWAVLRALSPNCRAIQRLVRRCSVIRGTRYRVVPLARTAKNTS